MKIVVEECRNYIAQKKMSRLPVPWLVWVWNWSDRHNKEKNDRHKHRKTGMGWYIFSGGETLAAWELGCLLHGVKGGDEIASPW